jgi:hypothetical protein
MTAKKTADKVSQEDLYKLYSKLTKAEIKELFNFVVKNFTDTVNSKELTDKAKVVMIMDIGNVVKNARSFAPIHAALEKGGYLKP